MRHGRDHASRHGHHLGGTGRPEGHRHRPGRRPAEAGRPRCAHGDGARVRLQGVPAHVGEGERELGGRRAGARDPGVRGLMRAERVTLSPAYVLHQRPWRETSRIAEIWSREHGRLGLVARGVRRPRSPHRSLLQPFMPLLVSWTQRGELGNLTGLEAAAPAVMLQGRALMAGFYLNELLLRLFPRQDPHPALYERYASALEGLATRRTAPVLRVFEKHLI